MDPYKGSPKEFIHLLVMAAMRDEEISKAICRMNEERIKNPSSWQPVRPHGLSTLGGQSRPQQNQPLPLANGHVQQQAMATGSPGSGPQQPPISQTVVYYVYPPPQPNLPHQVIPGPVYGAPTPNMYPPFLPPQLPPGVGTPPQHMAPYAAGALPGQAGVPVTHTVPNAPYPPVPPQPMSQQPSAQQPIPPAKDNASSRRSANGARQSNSSNNALANGGVALDTNANSNRPTNRNGGANDDSRPGNDGGSNMNGSTDTSDSDIELEDQPSGNKEQSCNFTWVVDRAETQLGWTGNWDKESDIRQDTIGQSTAFKLQKLLKRMGAMFDRYLDFSNRVHILTVMREVIIATLDTDSRVGRRCRENAKEYDDTFVEAVSKLIPAHKKDLKALEGGKWMEEMKLLIKEADRQSLFPRLVEVLALLEA
ncbi:hypothetical protein F4804DRAFT_298500 [Jackrogersella minutella]|nr:hypothetical protein F4804DRAFT_298500 [Jackrogersella minutella]